MSDDKTISITEARKRIFQLAEDVQRPDVTYTLTEYGKPKVVMLSAQEFSSLMETLEVTRILPDLADEVRVAERDYKGGRTIALDAVGRSAADNHTKKPHVVPRRPRKKGKS